MKVRHVLLAGAAILVSVPLALAATPDEEREITRQLNQQQLSSPGATTGVEAKAEADMSVDTSAEADASADVDVSAEADTTADTTVAEAPDATPMTNEDRPNTEDTDTARHDSGVVGQAANEVANEVDQAVSPDAPLTEDAAKNGVELSTVTAPKDTLANATVETTSGEAVGEVQSVLVDADGKATAIVVEAGGFLGIDEEPVQISADKFVYIADRNILVTELNKEAIEDLAEAKNQ